jgi:hypothetical protein
MRQAIEIGKFSSCTPRTPSWHARLRAWLFGRPAGRKPIPWDQRSAHLMRDIGLMEDGRGNELLRDRNFMRR